MSRNKHSCPLSLKRTSAKPRQRSGKGGSQRVRHHRDYPRLNMPLSYGQKPYVAQKKTHPTMTCEPPRADDSLVKTQPIPPSPQQSRPEQTSTRKRIECKRTRTNHVQKKQHVFNMQSFFHPRSTICSPYKQDAARDSPTCIRGALHLPASIGKSRFQMLTKEHRVFTLLLSVSQDC